MPNVSSKTHNFNKVLDALNMADGLMAGDPAKFKSGYTRENAELAVIEALGLEGEDEASFRRVMAQKHG